MNRTTNYYVNLIVGAIYGLVTVHVFDAPNWFGVFASFAVWKLYEIEDRLKGE